MPEVTSRALLILSKLEGVFDGFRIFRRLPPGKAWGLATLDRPHLRCSREIGRHTSRLYRTPFYEEPGRNNPWDDRSYSHRGSYLCTREGFSGLNEYPQGILGSALSRRCRHTPVVFLEYPLRNTRVYNFSCSIVSCFFEEQAALIKWGLF